MALVVTTFLPMHMANVALPLMSWAATQRNPFRASLWIWMYCQLLSWWHLVRATNFRQLTYLQVSMLDCSSFCLDIYAAFERLCLWFCGFVQMGILIILTEVVSRRQCIGCKFLLFRYHCIHGGDHASCYDCWPSSEHIRAFVRLSCTLWLLNCQKFSQSTCL